MSFVWSNADGNQVNHLIRKGDESMLKEQCAKERRNIEQYDAQIKTLVYFYEEMQKLLVSTKEKIPPLALAEYTSLEERIKAGREEVTKRQAERDELLGNVERLEKAFVS